MKQSASSPKSLICSCQRQQDSFHLIGSNPRGVAKSAFNFLRKKKKGKLKWLRYVGAEGYFGLFDCSSGTKINVKAWAGHFFLLMYLWQ